SANAMEIATWLEGHPKVERVGYPGLPSFPGHELARKQARGFGAMVWFEVTGGVEAGKKLMDSVRLWSLAENLGAVESIITHPVTMTHAAVPPEERARAGITDGLVRLSVGMEDVEDLIADLDQALSQICLSGAGESSEARRGGQACALPSARCGSGRWPRTWEPWSRSSPTRSR